jgi:hypothetical protein
MPKRSILLGLAVLQILLMGAAFVGGRMMAGQSRRGPGQGMAQLPSQLPKEPMAGSGTVQKIQNSVITLSRGGFGGPPGQSGPGGGPGGGSSSSNQTDVAVSADTKYYKSTSSGGPGMPGASGGGQIDVQDATLSDVKVGNMVMVWGAKNGERITAEVVYIQGSFGP